MMPRCREEITMIQMNRYEYQLKDVLRNADGSEKGSGYTFLVAEATPYSDAIHGLWEWASIATVGPRLEPLCDSLDDDAHTLKLLIEYIAPRCFEKTILVVEQDEYPANREVYSLFCKMVNWINMTKDYHEKIINAIAGISDFMASVKDVNKTYFNDTPQSPNPDLDTHVTNYTKSESENPLATPAARLDEIRRLYENELENWCNDFIDTFIIM